MHDVIDVDVRSDNGVPKNAGSYNEPIDVDALSDEESQEEDRSNMEIIG